MEQTMKLTANKVSEDISKAIDSRLKELGQDVVQMRNTIQSTHNALNSTLSRTMEEIKGRLTEIGNNMGSRGRNRSP
ncbi:6828_t:CDS:1, partial [Funneliformis geosporum]